MPVQQIAVLAPTYINMDVEANEQAHVGSSQVEERTNGEKAHNILVDSEHGTEREVSERVEITCDTKTVKYEVADCASKMVDLDKHVEADTVIIRDLSSESSPSDDGSMQAKHWVETQAGHPGTDVTTGNPRNNSGKVKSSNRSGKKEKPTPIKKKDSGTQETLQPNSPAPLSAERCDSSMSNTDVCRICQCDTCEIQKESPLVAPCLCSGSLKYIHQACLQKWIKSSDKMSCELCQFEYHMTKKTKPFREWERLDMTPAERRKVVCSVTFHVIAITCVVWSLYVLIDRTTEEVEAGSLLWPFWTKLIVVAIGFTGGVVFMYVQCKMYLNLCKKWRTYNKVILVSSITDAQREKANNESHLKMSEKEAQLEEEHRGTNFDVFTIVQET